MYPALQKTKEISPLICSVFIGHNPSIQERPWGTGPISQFDSRTNADREYDQQNDMLLSRGKGTKDIDVAIVINIAKAAGDVIMKVYKEDPETWNSRSKSDDTPVTKADVMADELISTRLRADYPDIPIISEETDHLPYEQRRDFEYCWIVDPLDGTKEFINRTGDFAVMIGLVLRSKPVLGVVHAPALNEPKTYFAVAGEGAFVLPGTAGISVNEREPIRVNTFDVMDSGLKLAVSNSRPPEGFIATCDNPVRMSIGSAALKAIAVAEGTADMFPCFYTTSEWDTCATQAIVEEAGGAVLRYDGAGERGMAEIAALKERTLKTTSNETTTPLGDGDGDADNHRAVHDPQLSYNKESLASPHCLFMGRCPS